MGSSAFFRRLKRSTPRGDPAPSQDELRERMVRNQIEARGVRDPRVLSALREIPRERFVPPELRHAGFGDCALPIGAEQTISQPFMVGLMTEQLELRTEDRVLEIGTGSGYQTAILASLCREVFTIERLSGLARKAELTLTELGISNVHYRVADGSLGWPEEAPFSRILVTAGAPSAPPSLLGQLEEGGRLVIPTGGRSRQELCVHEKRGPERYEVIKTIPCAFVPLIGEEGWEDDLP